MLDFELLRAFVTVADCGGFHRCVYRKLKLGRSGGEVRPGWQVS